METTPSVYDNPTHLEQLEQLVASLKSNHEYQLAAAEVLDKKAWDILNTSSAIFGIVTGLQISFSNGANKPLFWLGVIGVVSLYALLVREVLQAVKPVEWRLVPGGRQGKVSYETLLERYILVNRETYYRQLIVDYAGGDSVKNPGTFIKGAIEDAQGINKTKAWHISQSTKLLGGIVFSLVALAFVSTF